MSSSENKQEKISDNTSTTLIDHKQKTVNENKVEKRFTYLCTLDVGSQNESIDDSIDYDNNTEKKSLQKTTKSQPFVKHSNKIFEGTCFLCLNRNHSKNYCPLRKCSVCGEYGHSERVCLCSGAYQLKWKTWKGSLNKQNKKDDYQQQYSIICNNIRNHQPCSTNNKKKDSSITDKKVYKKKPTDTLNREQQFLFDEDTLDNTIYHLEDQNKLNVELASGILDTSSKHVDHSGATTPLQFANAKVQFDRHEDVSNDLIIMNHQDCQDHYESASNQRAHSTTDLDQCLYNDPVHTDLLPKRHFRDFSAQWKQLYSSEQNTDYYENWENSIAVSSPMSCQHSI